MEAKAVLGVRHVLLLQKLDISSAKHESVQRELEAAQEAQKLAHAEVQNRSSHIEQAQVASATPHAWPGLALDRISDFYQLHWHTSAVHIIVVLQARQRRVEAALEKEQTAHRNARARITKAEERAAMERTARR